jgi:hypothetical protein
MVKQTKRKRAKRNTKKGGIGGLFMFKTEWDNKNNWKRLWKDIGYPVYDPTMNYPSRRGFYPTPKPPKSVTNDDLYVEDKSSYDIY